ncbi:MAG: glycosyltransferase family 2 protein [Bacteroidales bacterium]|nr:glycosyltransferase family 2 protein [Bacteroidales bacterium]
MEEPLISVVVPIYGVEAYIGECARSLLAQPSDNVEFIFVNDGTRDRSMEVLSQVLDACPGRAVKIINQANAGLPQARMAGIRAAEGEYIMHLDADDWLEAGALERLCTEARTTGADLIYYDFWKEYGTRSKLDRERDFTPAGKTGWMRRLYRDGAYGYVWCKMARKSLYEGIFVPRHTMHEDVVFSTQLIFRAASFVHLRQPLVHYRRNNPSASTRVARKIRRGQMARNYLDLYEHYRDSLAGSPVEPVLNDLLLRAAYVGFSLDRDLFRERPYLKEMARHLPLMPFHRVLLAEQLILKLWLLW